MNQEARALRGLLVLAAAVLCRLLGEQSFCLMVVDERIEDAFGDLAFIGVELTDGLELDFERLIGSALGIFED